MANATEYPDDDAMLLRYHTNLSEHVPRVDPRPLGHATALSPEIAAMVDTWPQQIRINKYKDSEGTDRGKCTNFMTPLMYMLLGDFFDSYQYKNPRVNCKIYALDDLDLRISNSLFGQANYIIDAIGEFFREPLVFAMFSSKIGVKSYGPHSEQIPSPILRRCITFGFETFFTGTGMQGHKVVLMIQREGTGPIEVVLVDNVPTEDYRYQTIHKIILDTAEKGIIASFQRRGFYTHGRNGGFSNDIEIVKSTLITADLMKYEEPDLECISMAARACIYLHIVGDYRNMQEPPIAFRGHLKSFEGHMDRMTTWIHTEPLITSQRAVPVVSWPMTGSFWPIDSRNCYLVLMAPMAIPEGLVDEYAPRQVQMRERKKYLYDHALQIKFSFSPNGDQIFTNRRIREGFSFNANGEQIFSKRCEMTPDKSICVTSSGYRFLY